VAAGGEIVWGEGVDAAGGDEEDGGECDGQGGGYGECGGGDGGVGWECQEVSRAERRRVLVRR
jgi:hypothetical protein